MQVFRSAIWPTLLATTAFIFAGACGNRTPVVVKGYGEKPYDEPAAPFAIIQTSHVDSRLIRPSVVLKTGNHVLLEGKTERFPVGGLLYVAVQTPGGKWRIIPSPAEVSYTGEWRLSAELIPGGPVVETEVAVKAFVAREAPKAPEYEDADLRAVTYTEATPVSVIVMPSRELHGAASVTVDSIQGQSPGLQRAVFTPTIFWASGSLSNVPPGAGIWIAGQCGRGEWQVIATANHDRQTWSVENAAWPYRGREASVSCHLLALVRFGAPGEKAQPLAKLEKGALALTDQSSVVITPVHLEISTITSSGREIELFDEMETGPVIQNTSLRVQIRVAGGRIRDADHIFLTLQPADSVYAFAIGPGKRIDDGHWVFDRVPMGFPGYPASKQVLVGAVVSDVDLKGRALTQPELAETMLGYAPVVHVAAVGLSPHAPVEYNITSAGGVGVSEGVRASRSWKVQQLRSRANLHAISGT